MNGTGLEPTWNNAFAPWGATNLIGFTKKHSRAGKVMKTCVSRLELQAVGQRKGGRAS